MPGLTIDNPVTLSRAIASTKVLPGDVLSVADGIYSGDFVATITGSMDDPVIVRARNAGGVKINGGMLITGKHIRFEGIEFCYSGWETRLSSLAGSAPSDIQSKNLYAAGDDVSFVDCSIHDYFSPLFPTIGGDIIGCHIYNNGWKGPDRGHGHGIYSQNGPAPDMQTKLYRYNIVHDNFGWGFHIWDEAAYLNEYTVEHNISFRAGSPGGGTYPNFIHKGYGPRNLHNYYRYNYSYDGRGDEFGLANGMDYGELIGNYFANGIVKTAWGANMVETGNIYGTIGNAVFVNPYKSTVAHVAIYNEAGTDNVTVDLTTVTGLSAGDTVTAWNVQAGAGNDLQTLTLDANKCIAVDMQAANRSVAAPIGWTAPATTFPTFGCFIVNKA